MLVDGHTAQIPESLEVIRVIHDAVVVGRRPSHEITRENGGTRRRTTNDSTAIEYSLKRLLGLRSGIRVDQPIVTPAAEPHTTRVRDLRDERVGIRHRAIRGVVHDHILRTGCAESAPNGRKIDGVRTRGRNFDDQRVRPAGKFDELGEQIGTLRTTTHHHHGAVRRSDGRCAWSLRGSVRGC